MKNQPIIVEDIPDDADYDADNDGERAITAIRQRSLTSVRRGQALRRAAGDWPMVKTNEDWSAVSQQAGSDYDDGTFLMRQLGGESALEPSMAATLLHVRERIISDWEITGAAELALLDLALLAYRNALRVQGWIENLALLVEAQCFGIDPPSVRYSHSHKFADGLVVEEHLARMREQVLPLLDRANRLFIRNLQQIKQMRAETAPFVSVGRAVQVNVGAVQTNSLTTRSPS